MTFSPAFARSGITFCHEEPSANAPCTRIAVLAASSAERAGTASMTNSPAKTMKLAIDLHARIFGPYQLTSPDKIIGRPYRRACSPVAGCYSRRAELERRAESSSRAGGERQRRQA